MRSSIVRALALSLAFAGPMAVSSLVAASSAEQEQEPDLALGERLHRQCALCHGLYSQGILGGKYPRLAGQHDYYTTKSLIDYRDGTRVHAAMTVVGGLRSMSDQDLASLSAYIASIDLNAVHPLDVPTPEGADVDNGSGLYRSNCRTCHGRAAEGNKRKESPMLVGQYDGYLFREIEKFKTGKRVHANDPEDETFAEFSDQEILDIIGFLTTLDDKS
ncbi:MAG: c-type cytochrome [Sphingobacteriia bacterium]|nr:c-type cytochrome [Sphingobacteriia bacterium]NCC40013.1 c-type cytochrome [Gammaproteobacteria bacterium]